MTRICFSRLFVNFLLHYAVLLILIIPLAFFSCKEDPTSIGIEVLPDADLINAYDTIITIEAYTLGLDSLYSRGKSLSPVGNYNDPVFGKVMTGLVTEYGPFYKLYFPDDAVADSLILQLYFNKTNYYGKDPMNNLPDIKVYSLNSKLYDTNYFASYEPDYNPLPVSASEATLTKYEKDTVWRDTTIISIKLSMDYANLIMSERNDTIDENEFKAEIFGFFIKAQEGSRDGSVVYLDLSNSNSSLSLYYHTGDNKTHIVDFNFSPYNDITFNVAQFDRTNSDVAKVINDTIHQDSVIYLQSMGGTVNYLKFPDIRNLKQSLGNISVVKAELILPVEGSDLSAEDYAKPGQIGLRYIASDGKKYRLPDDPYYSGSNGIKYFSGQYLDSKKAYTFRLDNFFQQYFAGNLDFKGLELYVGNFVSYNYGQIVDIEYNAISLNRVVLTSGNNSNPLKLKLYYVPY
jgi:hypothetical protein